MIYNKQTSLPQTRTVFRFHHQTVRITTNMANREKEIKLFGKGSVIQVGSDTKPTQHQWRDKVCSMEM